MIANCLQTIRKMMANCLQTIREMFANDTRYRILRAATREQFVELLISLVRVRAHGMVDVEDT